MLAPVGRSKTSLHRACVAAAAAAWLVAAGAFAALGPRYGGTLRVGVLDLPAMLDPAAPETPGARLLGALVHETLVGVGPEGLPTPGLVSTWTSAAGAREWTLTLDPGARFHDDQPVTSEDALRSLRRFLRSPSPAAAWLARGLDGGAVFRAKRTSALPGLEAPDARRLVLRFAEPQALPLAPLASPLAAVTSAAGLGCGPFIVTAHRPGRQVTLNAFGAHVRGRPYLDEIDVLGVRDAETLRADLAGGRLDVALDTALGLAPGRGAPADDWGAGGALGEPQAPARPRAAILLLVLDPAHAPFNKAETRAALPALVDRDTLVRHFLPGAEAWSTLVPPSLLPGLPAAPAAPAAPVAGRLTLVVARDVPPAASQRLVALLSDAGFVVRVDARGPAEARHAPADARLLLFVPEVAEAALALNEIAALGPDVPTADDVLAAARVESGLDRRRALLHAAEQALRADDVRLALAALPLEAASAPRLHGLHVDAAGRLQLEDAWREP